MIDLNIISLQGIRKILTYDKAKRENGYLIELLKDGEKTLSYLTAIYPGFFKGYHLHKIRNANYVCIKGKIKIILYDLNNKIKGEVILDSNNLERLHIPINIATGLENICNEEVQLINFPDPPYEPSHLKIGEQIEYTKERLEGLMK
ncbi:MAG: WxcM-like domain-containing protein [Nanoarchaeota archaeon]